MDWKDILDQVTAAEAQLDQTQAYFNENKHLLDEDASWFVQANVDMCRFQFQIIRLTVTMFSHR